MGPESCGDKPGVAIHEDGVQRLQGEAPGSHPPCGALVPVLGKWGLQEYRELIDIPKAFAGMLAAITWRKKWPQLWAGLCFISRKATEAECE